jgi:hypothetical protein
MEKTLNNFSTKRIDPAIGNLSGKMGESKPQAQQFCRALGA